MTNREDPRSDLPSAICTESTIRSEPDAQQRQIVRSWLHDHECSLPTAPAPGESGSMALGLAVTLFAVLRGVVAVRYRATRRGSRVAPSTAGAPTVPTATGPWKSRRRIGRRPVAADVRA